VYSERLKGYRQALEDRGIKYDPSLVFITELTEADGIDTIRKILRLKSRPDGIFASNDNSAVGALIELRKRVVIVQDEIAVAGFNNEPISHIIKPELTTVDYPAMEIGEIAAKALIDKLQNANGVNLSTVILNHKLIVRESSLFGKTAGS
jgi:LacI family transcriptional regulator